MQTNLVWITPNAEQVITDCARVSNPANQGKDGAGLIQFLVRNKHWSPFEMASACVEVTTSKAIAIQMLRHRSFSFQEFSQRYAVATDVERVQLRSQAVKNRQSSLDPVDNIDLNMYAQEALQYSRWAYERLIEGGVAKECARMVLPMATSTTLYMAGTVRSWIHYLEQRTDEHAQLEHREVANGIAGLLADHLPVILDAVGLA
jgi:thymidylate synthase (FAD)